MQVRILLTCALLAAITLFVAAGCATSAPPLPTAQLGFLIDPRIGFEGKADPTTEKRFGAAWARLAHGYVAEADRELASIETASPGFLPARVGRAAAALAFGDTERAGAEISRVLGVQSDYVAAEAYGAEVALRRGDVAAAYATYQILASVPGTSTAVRERFEAVSQERFRQLLALASGAGSNDQAIALLEQAVAMMPQSDVAREQLARRLVATQQYADARVHVNALLDHGKIDDPAVQALLADIEAGEGNYQAAIIRLERLVTRYPGRGYDVRLATIKTAYKRANLPPRYNTAATAATLTRADLAILSYWEVSAYRFAPIADPPIAVDLAAVPGREEIVQALGMRLLTVDPITRAVDPSRAVNGTAMLRAAALLLRTGGAPPCAGSGTTTAVEALQRCGVPVAAVAALPDAPVSGAAALEILSAIENAKRSTE